MNAHSETSGAIASNAGDEFHEVWALREALKLLNPGEAISAISLEGVVPSDRSETREWEGVDCAAYIGGSDIASSRRIHLIQLKYSVSQPKKNWTLSRLTSNAAKRGNNSVARRLGAAFAAASRGKEKEFVRERISVSLVSNQPISSALDDLIQRIRRGSVSSNDAQKLRKATGLTKAQFLIFCDSLRLRGGSDSRPVIKAKLVKETLIYSSHRG